MTSNPDRDKRIIKGVGLEVVGQFEERRLF